MGKAAPYSDQQHAAYNGALARLHTPSRTPVDAREQGMRWLAASNANDFQRSLHGLQVDERRLQGHENQIGVPEPNATLH
jgi:hypothetical protein